ncbi:MAG: 1-acyl-sn-glycerol-3-phosphate acyltransferase [Acidimicrobiaceae bacterium]|nr:1-acyl-sn-glycerol-3-phosphate acyltransferase [Acidimicrobiaceae bacterium]
MSPAPVVNVAAAPGRGELLLYRIVRGIVVGFCKLFWRVRFDGLEHVPARGPFVLAPVHRSNVDTPLVAGVTRRRMRFMGKDSMWKIKPIGRLFSALGAFPVHRGTVDREALRRTIEVLQAGEPVVIFPEGTRQSGPLVQPLFEGAAYVAARTGVPIVPVGIGGSEQAMPKGAKMLKPVKVHIVVGEPLVPPPLGPGERAPRRVVHEMTEDLHARLQALFDQAQVRATR